MAGAAVSLYALLVVVAVVLVWAITHRRRADQVPAHLAPVIAAARRRALVGVLCAIVVFLAGAIAAVSMPVLLGLPLAVTPLLAAAAGLALYAATPPRSITVADDQPRTAGLSRRSWLTVIPGGWLHACLEIAAIFIVVVVFCGLTADADDQGRSRAIRFETAGQASWSSPYPGWFYGIPALIALAVLVAAVVVALQRIGTTAAFPSPDDSDADAQWRRASASVVLSLATGAVLFSLGGIALMAGVTMNNAIIDGATPVVWDVVADVLVISGILSLVLSVVAVTLAALTAFTIGDRVVRVEGARR
ncbi:hypothetical protein [Microbacterium esteraromaticum]|uniref:hypothetical protein n=1 Tax=Microbacterium esteraromaticum TaxID=57043 RepID=UPI0019D35EBF|nr:hypothetical protein [Microbacterium esteraromaticum]MBN7794825.1 hypothetical protein [Microbacterium esteraromaticum]